jgi:hypothetical protein
MDIYRIPRREVLVRILLDDGRTLDGTLFTAETGPGGPPEDVLHYLNETDESFVPLLCGRDSFSPSTRPASSGSADRPRREVAGEPSTRGVPARVPRRRIERSNPAIDAARAAGSDYLNASVGSSVAGEETVTFGAAPS